MRSDIAKAQRALFGTIGYLAVLLCVYFLHVRFFRVDVVFYSVLFDVVVATALAGLVLAGLGYFSVLGRFEKMQLAVAWLLLGYVYAISVPTVIDRSLSFYILEKMQQRGGGIRLDRFEDIFTKEYSREHQLVAVRLTEQQASGTVTIRDGCVRLTPRGQHLASFSRFFRQNLLPRHRRLMDRYTDELTNPFSHSEQDSRDACR